MPHTAELIAAEIAAAQTLLDSTLDVDCVSIVVPDGDGGTVVYEVTRCGVERLALDRAALRLTEEPLPPLATNRPPRRGLTLLEAAVYAAGLAAVVGWLLYAAAGK